MEEEPFEFMSFDVDRKDTHEAIHEAGTYLDKLSQYGYLVLEKNVVTGFSTCIVGNTGIASWIESHPKELWINTTPSRPRKEISWAPVKTYEIDDQLIVWLHLRW